ncbi:unnamed protein product [Cochlearia groenlandica]
MAESNSTPSDVITSSKKQKRYHLRDRLTTKLWLKISAKYMGDLGFHFEIDRNDELTVDELKKFLEERKRRLTRLWDFITNSLGTWTMCVPLFGVCMGLQCIGEAFRGKIVRSPFGVMHGQSSMVYYDEKGEEGRYHSLVIEDSFPSDEIEVTVWTWFGYGGPTQDTQTYTGKNGLAGSSVSS